MRKRIVLLLALLPALFGGQSLRLTGDLGQVNSSLDLIAGTSDIRVEGRLRSVTDAGSNKSLIVLSGVGFRVDLVATVGIYITFPRDTGAIECIVPFSRTDFLFRLQRLYNGGSPIHQCETWNPDGTGYTSVVDNTVGVQSWSSTGAALFGPSDAYVDYLRVFTTTVPMGGKPPATADNAGAWAAWQFDGNANDSSGNGRNLTVSPYGFASSPASIVVALSKTSDTPYWANFRPLRAGHADSLDGSGSYSMSDTSSAVSCFWQQLSGPSTAVFDNRAICSPTLTGLVFGSYQFRLRVTDADGLVSVKDQYIGAVAYDDNGVVIYPDERLNTFLGPQIVRGQGPWGYSDEWQYRLSKELAMEYTVNGGTVQLPNLKPDLAGTPLSGTAWWNDTASGGTRPVYGVGTSWLNIFCGGSAGPASGLFWIVFNQPTPAWGGATGVPRPLYATVNSCVSDTEIVVTPYLESERSELVASPGVTWGIYYGQIGDMGNWNASNPMSIGYYDTSLAYWRAYYRSGDHEIYNAAKYMTTVQFRNPYFAQWVGRSEPPVSVAMAATIMPEIWDGKDPWPMIKSRIDGCLTKITVDQPDDQREDAYCVWAAAMIAMGHPDPSVRSSYRTSLETHYNKQAIPNRMTNGGYYSYFPNQRDTARVWTVANGSATVTRYSGPTISSDYCGTPYAPGGTASVAGDGVSMTGTSTNWVGAGDKYVVLIGTLSGAPHMEVSYIAASPTPTATTMTLAWPWRGDSGSLTRIFIDPTGSELPIKVFEGITSANAVKSPRDFDTVDAYACTYVDGNTIQLHKPYAGDTSGGDIYRRVEAANRYAIYTPYPRQPFMDELRANAYAAAAEALAADNPTLSTNYWTLVGNLLDLIYNGLDPLSKGLPYFDSMPTCGPRDASKKTICDIITGASDEERDYLTEGIGAFAKYYEHTGLSADLTRGDAMYRYTYATTGYTAPVAGDGHSSTYVMGAQGVAKQKALGQAFGIGGGSTWPAARLGGPAAAENRTLTVQVGSPLAYGDRIRITATNASGVAVTNTCQAVACSVASDFRAGGQTVLIEYLNASSAVLARATQNVIVN